MEDFKKIAEALRSNQVRELLKGRKEPSNEEEAVELFLDVMKESGISVSRESLVRFLKLRENKYQEESAKAESAVKEALADTDLDTVAGGTLPNSTCDSTYHPGEWCWWTDSCSVVIIDYSGEGNGSIPYDPWDLGGTLVQRNDGWYEYQEEKLGSSEEL